VTASPEGGRTQMFAKRKPFQRFHEGASGVLARESELVVLARRRVMDSPGGNDQGRRTNDVPSLRYLAFLLFNNDLNRFFKTQDIQQKGAK
jgi:hypothetical protein